VPRGALVGQGLVQGVMAGVLGIWTFTAAIARLGPAGAAAFGAMVPVVTAVGAWAWLGERPRRSTGWPSSQRSAAWRWPVARCRCCAAPVHPSRLELSARER
jgi:EamA-like transporter family